MYHLKNFYKSISFFLSLYLICQILIIDICTAGNIKESMIFVAADDSTIPQKISDKYTISFLNRKIDLENNFYHSGYVIFTVVVLAALTGYLFGRRRGKKIAITKKCSSDVSEPFALTRSDRSEIPSEKEKPFIHKFDMATVLFADIKGFSEITDNLDPEILLEELNGFFYYFDTIIDRYHVEKIKTMGDAYMCAGGVPQKNRTNPVDVVLVALDVQNHLKQLSQQNPNMWRVRIGIHTGQVVAGMLGHKKPSFDIWGHTVNVASRLESSCMAEKINISGATYEKIKQYFDCEYQGILTCTNDFSYYVNGLKPEFIEIDADDQPVPNYAFFVQMQLLRLDDLAEFVENMMTDIASKLYFHNFKHTMDVYEHVELLALSENITDENLLLLKTAALMHDVGYTIPYNDDMEMLSEDIARETLPIYQYNPQQINRICSLMKATHYKSIPNGILEEIMHDANLMYYGRADYFTRTMSLFREQEEYRKIARKNEWFQNQVRYLTNHKFYTRAARVLVNVSSNQQMANLTGGKNGE